MDESFLTPKVRERIDADALRQLTVSRGGIDFSSNDYLGIVRQGLLQPNVPASLSHGSTGSRLLSGNSALAEQTEQKIAAFHQAPAALLYHSGYDANTGLLGCVPQKGDVILYDRLSHASIRDGIRLSFAEGFSFLHNDVEDLEKKLAQAAPSARQVFVVTESVFSMDGDRAPLREMAALCRKYRAALVVDEAHATGVIGGRGEGLVQELGLQEACFARIHTFGKACGCQGAAVIGSEMLKTYLINFSRPFIYSTAPAPASVAAIAAAYDLFPAMSEQRAHLRTLIALFRETPVRFTKAKSDTPVQAVVIPGNSEVRAVAAQLQQHGLDVRPILYPTVPRGGERLRIVLHAFNTREELTQLLQLLS